MTSGRLRGALVCYAVLAVISVAVLEGRFLGLILILFGGLALKSWIGYKREQIDEAERPPEASENHGTDPH